MLFSCILQYTFLIYQMLWSPVKREFCTPYSMFLEVHQYWKLKLHVFHTNMFICTVCTGINFLHFVVDVGLCMKIKGFQSLMKIVYTLNSTIICNIMILHSWVNGWSCITWYNVYVARVYRISNICSTVHWYILVVTFVHASWKVVHVYIYCILYWILSSCKWYNTELTRYKYSTPCSLIIIVSFIHGLVKRDVNVSYSQLQN